MWTPNEIRKLVAQLAGVVFGVGGIMLMISGVKATGKINISTNLISGEIESGSAGLLLLFFSFFLIVIPSLRNSAVIHSIETKLKSKNENNKIKEIKKLLLSTIIGIILTALLFFGGQWLKDSKYVFGGFLIFGGVITGLITGVMVIAIAIVYLTDEDENPKEIKKQSTK